ncbi:MAG: hybrid sensor histidine kinase/response regulator [Chroococcidiopsidaceae cyanobacterium CP_BM_ER_R8_30]|nr:hybrid sensor histidine kinase/response regulator [Chroococcidiopsidaceae cyanobacterium CP_BM_ER_R8_30]
MSQDKELEIRLQFLEEAAEYLNIIESGILGLATKVIDHQQVDALLRAAHSVKGGAAMMGFQTLSDLAHRLEDFFKALRGQQQAITSDLESLLLGAVDLLRQVIAFSREGIVDEQWLEAKVNPVFEQLQQLSHEFAPVDDTATLLPEASQDMVATIFETEVEGCLQRLESVLADPKQPCLFEELSIMAQELGGLGEMLELNAFTHLCESITHHLEAIPDRVEEIAHLALQAWRRSKAVLLVGQVELLPTQIDLPESVASFDEQQSDAKTVQIPASAEEVPLRAAPWHTLSMLNPESEPATDSKENQENTVRVPIKQLELLSDLFGELTIERNGLDVHLERLRNLVRILGHWVRSLQRLPVEVMETIVRIQEVTDDIDLTLDDTDQNFSDLSRTGKQLQTTITELRMRPLSDLVGRFPRALRDLSLEYGKKVELTIHGGDISLDRTILDALNEPLLQLLRNAFAHGIEDAATRQACGKPEQGMIEISASVRGNQVLICVKDDGGGIALDKIRRQAHQLGLDAKAIAAASDEELLTLIFEPGFSTAEQVTNLSGRGVGLDVVRTNLRQIRGDIKVETQQGVGTTFTLSVPLTLSVTQVLLVESNRMLMAFPTDAIEEVLLLNPEQILKIADKEVISWAESMAPLIRLSHWLKFKCPQPTVDFENMPSVSVPTVLMLANNNELVALQVDRCWGEQEVAVRQVEGNIAMPPGFSGCTILGNGRVVPLVSVPDLLHWIATCKQSPDWEIEVKPSSNSAPSSQKDTILVVDDSINVRRFLSLTLEKAGYRVEQAKDGQDALEKLTNGMPVRAIVCDIDMPRLNGYGLLAKVKSDPAFKQLPIAMLTSRSDEKHRQLAMDLGATVYFSKPYNEQELIKTLKQLI